MSTESTAAPLPPDRLRSLDALRGFDMFWIIGGDRLGRALNKWYFDKPDNWQFTGVVKDWLRATWARLHEIWPARFGATPDDFVGEQLEHVEWQGFRFYDLIFPLFLFLVGAVIPFSVASIRRRGSSAGAVYLRIIRRAMLLFALGLLCNTALQLKWLLHTDDGWAVDIHNNLRVTGVLQRIAICYGIAAVIALNTGWRGQLMTVVVILLGYWAILGWVPNPDSGVRGDFTMEGNLGGWVDRHYLPGRLSPNYYGDRKSIAYGDNEGLLSTIPAVATALLGVLAGEWLRSPGGSGRKTSGLLVAGCVCLGLGNLWGLQFPVIKNLWTSSYVLIAGGWSFLSLALFYGVIDGLKWQRWAFPLVVIGVNAITIYVGQRFIDFPEMTKFFLGGAIRETGDFGPVLLEVGILMFEWLFLYVLYRQRLYLRV